MKKILLLFSLIISSATFAQLNTVAIGSSGNAFSVCCGARTNLWYDSVLNSVVFIHRSTLGVNGSTTLDDIRYDYSTDGGTTWSVDQGPVYGGNSTEGARYPQGVIYNPVGNTIPDSAFVTTYGPITNGTNYTANFEGTIQIGSSTDNQTLYMTANVPIAEGMHIVKNTGTTWVAAVGSNDTIYLAKGTFSGADFHYDFSHNFYAYMDSLSIADIATAWSDDGMIGYVVVLANDQQPVVTQVLYPIVFKSTDGGNTWIKTTNYGQNMNLNLLHTMLPNANDTLTTGFGVDCAVDKNNNLHIATVVGGSPGGYSIGTAYREWGIFDIYTTDGGNTWCGQLAGTPKTFRGDFGTTGSNTDPPLSEDSRQQASRSWDGSKIFITWFDTDTTLNPGVGNIEPNMFSKGYDVDNDMWTADTNLTEGSAADGFCTFGCVSYYVIQKGTDYCIPVVIGELAPITSTGEPVQYNYIDGACFSNFIHPSSCASLLSVTEINANNTTIKIYPNPLTSSSILELSATVNDAEVIIYDMVGKELLRKQFTGNRIEIERAALESGVYIVRVKAVERDYVQKLVIE